MFESSRLKQLIATVLLGVLFVLAPQPSVANGPREAATATRAGKSFAIRHPLPFKYGEQLKYEVKFSRFLINATVADLHFNVIQPNGTNQHIKFEVEAKSRGALVSLFDIDVHDMFTSLVDRDDMFVYSTIKNLKEGDYRSRREAVFDRQSGKVRVQAADLSNPKAQPVRTEADARTWVQDIVSAIYFARTRKLKKEGREVRFALCDEGQTYDIGVALAGREEIKVDAGVFKTLKVDARIFNGRFIQREGTLFLWLTDDERRIPVKAQMKTSNGTVTFNLTTLQEGTQAIAPSTTPRPNADADESEE